MKSAGYALALCLVFLPTGCGDSGGNGSSDDPVAALEGTPSQNPNCGALSGITATYFDFESGYLVSLPFTPLLAETGGVASAGDASVWSYPPGYTPQTLISGVLIARDDGQVLFKHSSGDTLLIDPALAFEQQAAIALQTFGYVTDDATLICGRDVTAGFQRLISGLFTTATHTFIVAIRVISAPTVGGTLSNVATRIAAAPNDEYPTIAGNVFLPMVWAQFPGGSGLLPQCDDGVDNDGDLLVDHPDDPDCSSPEDEDESR